MLERGHAGGLGLRELQQVGVEPDALFPADVDETPARNELPRKLAQRLADDKARAAAKIAQARPELDDALVLAADTVVAVGRRVLPKCELAEEAIECLRLLSGRNHRVLTGVALARPGGAIAVRAVETRVAFKTLSEAEIAATLGISRGAVKSTASRGLSALERRVRATSQEMAR